MIHLLLSILILSISNLVFASEDSLQVWAVPDTVRVDPQSGQVFENSDAYPTDDRWQTEYRDTNSVWKEKGKGTLSLRGARNEYVAAQIILEKTQQNIEQITINISDLKGPGIIERDKNIALFKEWYIQVTRPSEAYIKPIGLGWYPEALIPLDKQLPGDFGMPFNIPDKRNDIPDQQNQTLWIDIYIPKTAEKGLYEGSMNISYKSGDNISASTIPLRLEIWDFSLPDTFHLAPSLNTYGTPFRDEERKIQYFQIAHRHRCLCESFNPKPDFSGQGKELKLDWQKYDNIMSPMLDGSVFTDEYGYYGPGTGKSVSRIYLPFTSNKRWLGGAVPRGEPEHVETYQEALRQIEQHFMDKGWDKTTLVFFINDFDETKTIEGHESVEYYGKVLWNAGLNNPSQFAYRFDSGAFRNISHHIPEWTTSSLIEKLDEVTMWVICGAWRYISADGVANLRKQGKDAWFYFSNTSGEPCIGSCYIDAELIGLRTWPWICWRYNLTSACIWEWTYGARNVKRWTDPWTGEAGARGNGDACLVYDGEFIGIQNLCPSLRLKSLRRGAQDYEYMWMLANQYNQRDRVDEIVKHIVPKALDQNGTKPPGKWRHDPEAWEQARFKLAELILNQNH